MTEVYHMQTLTLPRVAEWLEMVNDKNLKSIKQNLISV